MAKLPEPIELKQPIAIRTEHVVPCPTTIRIRRRITPALMATGGDFTVWTCSNSHELDKAQEESKLFSVDSEYALPFSQRRHFRDTSGLPVFSISLKQGGATWFVHLPGANSTSEPMAILAPRWDLFTNKMHVYVMNSADNGTEVKLEVRGQVMFWKFTTEVYLNGALVMSAKVKDIRHLEWVVKVARGFDVSLVGLFAGLDWTGRI